jgi:hypothetical protein
VRVRRCTARFVCLKVLVTPSPRSLSPQLATELSVRSPIRPQDPARRRSSDSACGLSPTLPWLSFVFVSCFHLFFFPFFYFLFFISHNSRDDRIILGSPSVLHNTPSSTTLLTRHRQPPAKPATYSLQPTRYLASCLIASTFRSGSSINATPTSQLYYTSLRLFVL